MKGVQRRQEILLTLVIFLFATAFLLWSLISAPDNISGEIVGKLAFASYVALMVRWIHLAFSQVEKKEDIFGSSFGEYHNAIQNAKGKIWISQTWLPGVDRDAEEIIQVDEEVPVRILLASFKPVSPIWARISGRNILEDRAKENVCGSIAPFCRVKAEGKNENISIRFSFGHHPGWIAVVDSEVFWGPTPIHVDNQSRPIFFQKDSIMGPKGRFWSRQFLRLWKEFSHSYDEEHVYNDKLPGLSRERNNNTKSKNARSAQ